MRILSLSVKTIIGIVATVLLIGCGTAEDADVLLPARVAILEASLFTDNLTFCSRSSEGAVDSFWTPSKSLVNEIDARLPEVSSSASSAQKMLTEYARQYIGTYRNGRRYVYTNGFHQLYFAMLVETEASPAARSALQARMQVFPLGPVPQIPLGRDYWRVRPFNVCDGRQAFWGVEFDVESGVFGALTFNR